MRNPIASSIPASPLTEISQATDKATLLEILHRALQTHTHAQALQVIWQTHGVDQPLLPGQISLPLPASAERDQLAAGQIVVQGDIIHLPMVALGELRGWVTLHAPRELGSAAEIVAQAGTALTLLEQQANRTIANPELAAMDKVGRILSSTLQLDQVLVEIAGVVQSLITADTFFIALADETTDELAFAFLSSPQAASLPQQRWAVDQGLTGFILKSGEPVLTDDYLAECQHRQIEACVPAGFLPSHAWLGVPLRYHDHTLGVMVVASDDPQVRYTRADLQLLSSVAAQAAAAVANAQLYQHVEAQARQLATINHINRTINATLDPQQIPKLLLQELAAALQVKHGAILLVDHAADEYVMRYMLDSATQTAIEQQIVVPIEVIDEIFRQSDQIAQECDPQLGALLNYPTSEQACWVIHAPLSGQHIRAVVVLLRTGRFTATDIQLLQAVVEPATTTFEHAELHAHVNNALATHIADLEQRNQQLTNLVNVGNALRSTSDLYALGNQIVSTIQSITGSPRVLLCLADPERQQMRAFAQAGLDPNIVTPGREVVVSFEVGQELLQQAQSIGTVLYRLGLGRHWRMPSFEDGTFLMLFNPHGVLVGLIVLDLAGAEPLSTSLIQTLEVIANQAAIALDNARLVSEQQHTVDRLLALNAFSLAATTSQLSTDDLARMMVSGAVGTTNALGGGTWLFDPSGGLHRQIVELPFSCDDAITTLLDQTIDEYIEIQEPQLDRVLLDAGIKNVLAVPIRGAQLFLGQLWIAYGTPKISATDRETVVLYAKTVGAVLENIHLLDQVRTAYARLASILASTAEGILLVTNSQIVVANAALTHLLGLPPDPLEGSSFDDFCKQLAAVDSSLIVLREALWQVTAGKYTHREGELELRSPAQRYLAWSVLPVYSDTQPHAALLVLRDITPERQTEKLRRDLTHMIVHDLRAPLTNIMVASDLLLKPTTGSLMATQERMIQIVANSSRQMLDLINALLDVQRLEQRQLELQPQPVELFDLVEHVLERFEQVANERQLTLHNLTALLPPIMVDIGLIQRVVQNLVDNAIKFSPYGGAIFIRGAVATEHDLPPMHAPGRWAYVELADQGMGVPEQYRDLVFELFGQAPQGRGRGSGIGLAFCKLAVVAHGGMIWVVDSPEGGASFRFSIPLAPSRPSHI